ncbi:MAG: pyridoxal phosphate-dependent aminotransferase [Pseudomonadota bacterium]
MNASSDLTSRGQSIQVSKLRELANAAMNVDGLIALWFGEPDVPTPKFICDAVNASLADGKTYYTEGLGKPFLREAISRYMSRLYANRVSVDRIAVTASGTNALNLAFQLLLNPGDRVVVTMPSFPTLLTVPQLQHAELDAVALNPSSNGWSVDINQIIERAESAKVLLLNSPNNPTGWMLERQQIRDILEACRKSGTWIISDEVYARIVYEDTAAPSFAEFAEPEDRLIIVNSFSKSWAMTGWRLGWLTLPPSLLMECEKLMEFSMSCAPEFLQAGGLAAIEQGEQLISSQLERYRLGRDLALRKLSAIDGITCIPPRAAFYAYFRIDGIDDSVGFAERLAREAGVGIAPGITFEPSMKDWFRICFAKDEDLLEEALNRMEAFLASANVQ